MQTPKNESNRAAIRLSVVGFLLTLSWHTPPTPKRPSHRSAKPLRGKSGTVPAIQAPGRGS